MWQSRISTECIDDSMAANEPNRQPVNRQSANPAPTACSCATPHSANMVRLQATVGDVDLRGARLHRIENVEYLRGTTMSLDQIADLAAAFAASLGIRVA